MYLSKITIENFRCFGEGSNRFELPLKPGLTALVGENDAGKTAVIDAIRFVLGTTDQEWYRLEDADFYHGSGEIKIVCKFEDLNASDKRAFVEYLTYSEKEPVLYVNWIARDTGQMTKGRPYRRVEVCSGQQGDGPSLVQDVRDLLRAIYLRPLRDAEQALTSGRGSRLSQILQFTEKIKSVGVEYDPNSSDIDPDSLNVLGIGDFANALLEKHAGIKATRDDVDNHLEELSIRGSSLKSSIKVSGAKASPDIRLRQLLEKLDLNMGDEDKPGLGSNNLLFMACELLLLAQESEGNKLLLIEEPEAHLHPQRQLRVMKFLQEQAERKKIQILVTTHSPNLASAIKLNNIVMIRNGRAFSMAEEHTQLEPSDYGFLERFLDVTKANLFFARGVMIVEGDAENILLPTLASLIGRDFTEHGVSIVNVGGIGLRRYARIFQRKNSDKDWQLDIPVACIADMDVMPNCAPLIVGKKLNEDGSLPQERQWKVKSDFESEAALAEVRQKIVSRASGQSVKTFVSDEWTLEYDLAFSGLAEDVYVAAHLAKKDEALAEKSEHFNEDEQENEKAAATEAFKVLKQKAEKAVTDGEVNGCSYNEVLAATVYASFIKGTKASKAIAAQYLAGLLRSKHESCQLAPDGLRNQLPKYLAAAIDYVTGSTEKTYSAVGAAND